MLRRVCGEWRRNAATKRMRVPGVLGVRGVVDIRLLQNGSCLRWRSLVEKEQKEKSAFLSHKKTPSSMRMVHDTMRVFLRKVLASSSSCVVVVAFILCVAVAEGVTFERLEVSTEMPVSAIAFDSNAKRFYVREDVPARRVFTWILSRRRRATTVFVHGIERLARWRRTEKTNLDANRRARTNHFRSVRLPSFGRAAFDEEVCAVQHRFGSQ